MSGHGQQTLADGLLRLARETTDARCAGLARRLQRPVVAHVQGRPGVGVRTVTRALTAAGVPVGVAPDAGVAVRVIAETAKPEDIRAALDADRPGLVVLTKADLAGFGAGGPMRISQLRAAEVSRRCGGRPVEPVVGLLAVAALEPGVVDDDVMRGVAVLTHTPADLSSPDAFLTAEHRLSRADRQRLLDRLDLFGIAHAVLAVEAGADAAEVRRVLRRESRIDDVRARLDAAAAEVRYRRMLAVLAELEVLAVGDPAVARFLHGDDTAAARMAAAADVIASSGLIVDARDRGAADRVRTAVRWRRYGAGPVGPLHRACAADLARGALRAGAGRAW